jgi:hypothetical protein
MLCEPKNEQLVSGMWSRYLNTVLKSAASPISPAVIKSHKATFYMGATAMLSMVAAPLLHPGVRGDLEVVKQWLADLHKELEEALGVEGPR